MNRTQPASLYLHVPFCPYKCPYCDFVTHVGGDRLAQPYVDALAAEIRAIGEQFPHHELDTLYFGGGTPSMLSPKQLGQLLAATCTAFGIGSGAEVTLEANPDVVEPVKLKGFHAVGVNRLSLGVQSLHPTELQMLGRGHSPADVARAVRNARRAGFENVSIDLMYGVPNQTVESWRRTLSETIALEPEHISAYSLIVEPNTPFHRRRSTGKLPLPEDDSVADMYQDACVLLSAAGYDHYEVANWGRPGCESRHNLTYWHDDQFFAAGVGAYDYLHPYRSARVRGTKAYIDIMKSSDDPVQTRDHVDRMTERFEMVVMNLRLLNEGIDRQAYERRFGEMLESRYGSVLIDLMNQGFLHDDGCAFRLREEMVPLANEAWERFLPEPAAA